MKLLIIEQWSKRKFYQNIIRVTLKGDTHTKKEHSNQQEDYTTECINVKLRTNCSLQGLF